VADRQNLPHPGGVRSLIEMTRLERIYRKRVALPRDVSIYTKPNIKFVDPCVLATLHVTQSQISSS
jgi:hypothetical protein